MSEVKTITAGFEQTQPAPQVETGPSYESELATQLEREMARSKELWADMVQAAATTKHQPNLNVLRRISPDLEIPPDDAQAVFDQDVAAFRRTLASTGTLQKHYKHRQEMWAAYDTSNEKDYFREAKAEIEDLKARLKELNQAAADYTRANYLLVSHDQTIDRGARDNPRIFPGGREQIFKLAGKKDPRKPSSTKTKKKVTS